jgi:hypothetical protein
MKIEKKIIPYFWLFSGAYHKNLMTFKKKSKLGEFHSFFS